MTRLGGILMIQIEDQNMATLTQDYPNTNLAKTLPPHETGDLIQHLLKNTNFNLFPPTKNANITEYMAMLDGEWTPTTEDIIAYLEKHDAHLSGVFKDENGNTYRAYRNEIKPAGLLDGGNIPTRKSLID